MYDEKNGKKGIQWGNLLRGAIKFVVIIIALFLIIFVVTKCTRGIKNIKLSSDIFLVDYFSTSNKCLDIVSINRSFVFNKYIN